MEQIEAIKQNSSYYNKRFLINFELPTIDEFKDFFVQIAHREFCNYIVTDEIDKLLSYMYSYIFNDSFISIDPEKKKEIEVKDKNRGIFLAGPTGTGKTTFLKVLFRMIDLLKLRYTYKNKDYRLYPYETSEIIIRNEFNENGKFAAITYPTLFIDDIGQGYKVKHMGNDYNPIEEIILTRYDQYPHSLNFFTSNYPINSDKMTEFYGPRAADRLAAMCNYYILKETNFRKVYKKYIR